MPVRFLVAYYGTLYLLLVKSTKDEKEEHFGPEVNQWGDQFSGSRGVQTF